jgi:Cdc6-like AAA superfamily ATPase
MLNLKKGRPLAKISGGAYNNEIIYIDPDSTGYCNCCRKCSTSCKKKSCCKQCDIKSNLGTAVEIEGGILKPIYNLSGERSVDYISGPAGSGKSTYSSNLIKAYKMDNPNRDLFVFSRTDAKKDPAFTGMKLTQIPIDESIVEHPIDITKELTQGCLILFDDCNTINDDKQKKAIDKLMADIMEVGRKLMITIIITNHLVIPNEKKIARTIMNEMQTLTVFPKSGSVQQIRYCLKQYFGMNNKQIDQILSLPSRWITFLKHYPITIIWERGIFILE